MVMTLTELLAGGGGLLVLALTCIQIAPIKVNPWSALARILGRAINGEVLEKIDETENAIKDTRKQLDDHIRKDDERAADSNRQRILRFNDELIRGVKHSQEHYIEVLQDIDRYEAYCREHEGYQNSRAVHSIANIGRVYDERLQKNDFL